MWKSFFYLTNFDIISIKLLSLLKLWDNPLRYSVNCCTNPQGFIHLHKATNMCMHVLCKHLCYFHTNSIWFGMWPFVLAFLSCRQSVNLSKTPFTFAVVITGTTSSFSLFCTIFAVINLVHCIWPATLFFVQIKQLRALIVSLK
jgi:hypothetical protein